MEENNVNQLKTYLVVMIFILIILLSIYVVYKKITTKTNEKDVTEVKEQILDKSSNKLELSLSNKTVNNLYEIVSDKDVDYMMISYKDRTFDWDLKSFITVINLDDKNISNDLVESNLFKEKYKSIFGTEVENNLTSDECGSASYIEDSDSYKINRYCPINKNSTYIETYLKDIVMDDGFVKVNKYYVFLEKTIDGYNLYSNQSLGEENIIALDVSVDEISKYISKMNVISYNFKKGKDKNYYLHSVS